MHSARTAELLKPFFESALAHDASGSKLRSDDESAFLSSEQLELISTYIDILLRWNSRINLTAIRDEEEIVTRHFGESFFAARHLFPGRVSEAGANAERSAPAADFSLADVGSGAGFPGLPIKLWAPDIALTLIESNHKKATFLREVARALTLTNVDIQNARAESLIGLKADLTAGLKFDIVTLRAVERFEAILPIAASLLAPAGRLALLIGSSQQDQACARLPNLRWSHPIPIPLSQSRILLIGRQTD